MRGRVKIKKGDKILGVTVVPLVEERGTKEDNWG
jgi:hypothetical protein